MIVTFIFLVGEVEMRIVVGGKEIKLVEKDVKAARSMVSHFLESVKAHSTEYEAPTLYMTTLIVMHLMSKNQIDALTPESLKVLLDSNYNAETKE